MTYPVKRPLRRKKLVQTYTKRPNIALFPILGRKGLWRHKISSPCLIHFLPALCLNSGQPKIDQLDIAIAVNHDILQFHVSVNNTLLMAMLKSLSQLYYIPSTIIFCQRLFSLDDVGDQVVPLDKFCADVLVLRVIVALKVLSYVWMV
jgi:hypothetical protein